MDALRRHCGWMLLAAALGVQPAAEAQETSPFEIRDAKVTASDKVSSDAPFEIRATLRRTDEPDPSAPFSIRKSRLASKAAMATCGPRPDEILKSSFEPGELPPA